jgi:hypothetical protein
LQSQNRNVNNEIELSDEEDISAIKKKTYQYSRFQGKDVYTEWQTGSCCPQGKGKEEADRF